MTGFGTVSMDDFTASVRFERLYSASAAELRDVLTDPERMRRWLGAEASTGGAVRLRWDSGDAMDGVITIFEAGRLLEYTWREAAPDVESVVRFELQPAGSETPLILEHRRVPASQAAGFGAGWHGHLDALAGQTADPHARYRELKPEYTRRLAGSASR